MNPRMVLLAAILAALAVAVYIQQTYQPHPELNYDPRGGSRTVRDR